MFGFGVWLFEWDLPGAVDGGRHDVPVHVALLGGGVVDPLIVRRSRELRLCLSRPIPFCVAALRWRSPEGLVDLLGVVRSYFPQLEGHRVGMHMKWPRGGRHEVVGDSSLRQDPGESLPIEIAAAYGARERLHNRRYA